MTFQNLRKGEPLCPKFDVIRAPALFYRKCFARNASMAS